MASRNRLKHEKEVEEIRELLRERGIRATPARIAVLQELRKANSPLTHADIANKLVPLGFDKATVFRNLNGLAEAELVFRTELGDHVWRFEILDPDNPHEDKHPHFICMDCGGVSCLGNLEFTTRSQQQVRKAGNITEILIKGHCSDCEASLV